MKIDSQKLQRLMKAQGYSTAKLAEEAGVTRQALHTILQKNLTEVRGTTLRGLARALKLPDENLLGADALAGYKKLVAEEHTDLDFRALGLPTTEPRALNDLFVPVRVRSLPRPKHGQECDSMHSEISNEPAELSQKPSDLTFAECLQRHPRLLVRGEPGSGKTTSLRHAARSYATGTQRQAGYPDRPLTPVFVRLAAFAKALEGDANLSLVRFVLAGLPQGGSRQAAAALEKLLEEELRQGKCLVLLDGLDEAGSNVSLHTVLGRFIKLYSKNQFVLTSRAVGLDSGPWENLDFEACEITRWREEDIRHFAVRWYKARQGSSGERRRKEMEQRAEDLSKAILGHPPLREIAANPLMLTILAALHHANAALPRRRVDLYTKVVEVLLETWEAGKRDSRPGDPLRGVVLEPREFEWLLSRLALELQRQDRVLCARWWITEFVQEFLRDSLAFTGEAAKDQGDRLIRHLCERSGLLVERGADVFGFSHRTFQEYFAARGVVEEGRAGKNDAVNLLRPYLYHPRWEQVIRLVSAQLPPVQATALIRTILDDPDPAGRFLKRGLRLALRCLVDGAAVSDRRLLDEIFSEGDTLGKSKWLGITIDIIGILLELKASRHAADADQMVQQIEAAVQEFQKEKVIKYVQSECSTPLVRAASRVALDELIGEDFALTERVVTLLEKSNTPLVQQVTAQEVAKALTAGQLPWSSPLVEKVESILMAVSNPCPHVLDALEGLVNAKELRGGARLERILGDLLAGFGGRITLAFVFGSVARREQGQDSDIDLLIVGDVRLKEIAAALHAAEQSLGRVINPALYTAASFREKYHAGDPFLLDIDRKEKLFLKGSSEELKELVAERPAGRRSRNNRKGTEDEPGKLDA